MKKILTTFLLLLFGFFYSVYEYVKLPGELDHNTIVFTQSSPDDDYIAYIFTRDMGATTQKSYQLTVLPKNRAFRDVRGNTFVSYCEFDVEWLDDSVLLVSETKDDCNERAVFKKKEKIYGVTVYYDMTDE